MVKGWARLDSIVVKVLASHAPGSHMDAGSNPGSPASHPAPCLLPGKVVGDSPKPWDPAPMWDTGKSSWLMASDWLSSKHCGHLGNESLDGRSSSLSLLFVYLPFQ